MENKSENLVSQYVAKGFVSAQKAKEISDRGLWVRITDGIGERKQKINEINKIGEKMDLSKAESDRNFVLSLMGKN